MARESILPKLLSSIKFCAHFVILSILLIACFSQTRVTKSSYAFSLMRLYGGLAVTEGLDALM